MNKRSILVSYLMLWAAIAAGVIYGMYRAAYPLWAAVVSTCLLFHLVNGSLAYLAKSRQLRLDGKVPPPYLKYLFLPRGLPKFNDDALRVSHVLVGIVPTLTGAFFVICSSALAISGDWSKPDHPFILATFCLGLAGIGVAFLHLAWRLFAFARAAKNAT